MNARAETFGLVVDRRLDERRGPPRKAHPG